METTGEFWGKQPWITSDFQKVGIGDILDTARNVARGGKILSAQGRDPAVHFREWAARASFELSRRGVAPRWQGLVGCEWRGIQHIGEFADSESLKKQIEKIVKIDAALYDLVWLREQFAGKSKVSDKWGKLFARSPSVPLSYGPEERELMLDILGQVSEQKLTRPELMKSLGIKPWQQFGCLDLIERSVRTIPDMAGENIKRWTAERAERITRMKESQIPKVAEKQGVLKFAQTALVLPEALSEARERVETCLEALERCCDEREIGDYTDVHRDAVEALESLEAGIVGDNVKFARHKDAATIYGWVTGGKPHRNAQRTVESWRR